MSEQVQSWIDSSVAPRGARSIARAFLISLGVHVALVGMLWQGIWSLRQDAAPRAVRVELVPGARPISDVAAALTTAAVTPSSARRTKPHAAPLADAHTPSEHAPAHAAGVEVEAAQPASRAEADQPALAADVVPPPPGALPIDVRVLDWLKQYRTYPLAARRAGIEGVVQLRVTLLPDGRLVDARVERSSGHALLDQAALELLAHAAPLPSDFGSARSAQIELQLPIVYRMRASST